MLYSAQNKFALVLINALILAACGGGGGGGGSTPAPRGSMAIAEADSDHDGLIEIANLQQLDWIRNDFTGKSLTDFEHQVNSKGCPSSGCFGYELTADLDFDTNQDGILDNKDTYYDYDKDGSNTGWRPIPNFNGSFEGNGHRIRNLYIDRPKNNLDAGLFAQIYIAAGTTAKIQNIIFDGPLLSVTGRLSAGTLAGVISNQAQLTISHITQSGQVFATGSSIEDGAVASYWTAGGIVGEINSSSGSTLIIDFNSATSTVQSTTGMAGGLIARISAYDANEVIFTNNSVFSHVIGTGNAAGGLVGSMNIWSAAINTVTNNSSSGFVAGSYAGGLTGGLSIRQGTFQNNSSTASVVADGFAGGIIGDLSGSSTIIWNSHASGSVQGTTAGGLLGHMSCDNGLYVEESYATTDIFSPSTTSTSSGSITVNGGPAGGLIGQIDGTAAGSCGVKRSYASGSVLAGIAAGGIIGSVHLDNANSAIELSDTFAVNVVHAVLYAGGLIGKSQNNNGASFNVTRNLALGSVTADYGLSGPQVAGLVSVAGNSDQYAYNHWATDTTAVSTSVYMTGMSLIQIGNIGATRNSLECPTASSNFTCATGELFHDWNTSNNSQGQPVWDFGSTAQLPGLRINGSIHRPVFDNVFYSVLVEQIN